MARKRLRMSKYKAIEAWQIVSRVSRATKRSYSYLQSPPQGDNVS
jgi:hypothetical protein